MNRVEVGEQVSVDVAAATDEISPAAVKPAHVLVIGGAGYLGSVLVRTLLERVERVTIMDAFLFGEEGIRDVAGDPRIEIVRGDLRDLEAIVRACRDADAVVHLGGLVGDPACALDRQLTIEVNLEATRTIVRAARGLGVHRFVFASSCSVYGSSEDLLDEDSPIEPVSLYAASKMESERILLEALREDFAPVILRFGTFYGLSPRPRFDLIVNMLAAKAATEGAITVFGGDQWRPFIHVEDGCEAIVAALLAPVGDVAGQVFNVGSDRENHTIREVAELVREEMPRTRVDILEDQQDPANYRVSFDKIKRVLGFEPEHRLEDAIRDIHAAIASGSVEDYSAERYSNVRAMAAVVDPNRSEVASPDSLVQPTEASGSMPAVSNGLP
jgi:nucleoside-diphosphate-sugar epimerase